MLQSTLQYDDACCQYNRWLQCSLYRLYAIIKNYFNITKHVLKTKLPETIVSRSFDI